MDIIRIGIADDHNLFRKGIIELLSDNPRFEMILEADSGQLLLDQLAEKEVDVVLLDLKMPGLDGESTLQEINQHFPKVRVIILSMIYDAQAIFHLIKQGAKSFLPKNIDIEELETCIYAVYNTGFYFNEMITRAITQGLANPSRAITALQKEAQFNENEIKILQLISEGKTNLEIGHIIFLSPRTIEGYRKRMMEKTDTRNSAELVAWAFRNRLLP